MNKKTKTQLNKHGGKMENKVAITLIVVCALCGFLLASLLVQPNVIEVEKPVIKEVIKEVKGETIYETVTETVEIEVGVADTSLVLDEAVQTMLEELEDNDDLERYLRCGFNEYDSDEISVSKVYDDYSIIIGEDTKQVNFKVKLVYDEDDERSCKQTYNVSVFEEEDEDVEVTLR